jgi:hypothetical protein
MPGIMNIQTARRGSYMKRTQGGTKSNRRSAPSKSFKEKKKAEYKQKKAEENLNTYINNNQNLKNQSTYIGSGGKDDRSVLSTVSDSPQKFGKNKESRKEFVERQLRENDGKLNEAAKAILNFYDDGRNDYQRGLNALRTSSPEAEQAYAKRFPVENFAMKMGPMIAGAATGVPFGLMDLLSKGKNKFNNLPERGDILGAIARTANDIASSFTPEQAKNINTNIETKKPIDKLLRDQNIINASTDVDPILRAAAAQTGSQDIVDIFDNDGEKAAMEAALTPGDIVYNPYVEAPYQSKLDFINKVYGTNFSADRSGILLGENQANELFEKAKQEQGMDIREEINQDFSVDDEDPIPGGQFNLTSPTVNEDTVPVILGGAGPDYDYTDFNVNQQLADVLPTDNMFPEGGVSGNFVDNGNVQRSFVDDNYGKENPDIFVNDEKFDSSGLGFGFANGGSTNKYENMSTHEKLMRMAAEMYG